MWDKRFISKSLRLYMWKVKKSNHRHGFTWSNKEDEIIYKNGVTVCWFVGRSIKAQMLVEALTYETRRKVDFSIACGRIHVDTLPENAERCKEYLSNSKWMKKFIQPYELDMCKKYTDAEQAYVDAKNSYYLEFI